jgi:tetratricopeptide (TPR) repeat protein
MLKGIIRTGFLASGLALILSAGLYPQTRRQASAPPRIKTEGNLIQLTLDPDAHEMKATAFIIFKAIESTDVVVFEISDNLSITKVADAQGNSLDFGQDEVGPGTLAIRFPKALGSGESTTVRIEYTGGFDLDRFSRNYTKDESSAYVGLEGTYLLYPSKWYPTNKLFADRPTVTVEVTVPLGMVAVGPGVPAPIITRGITETFGWVAKRPVMNASIVAGRYFQRKMEFGGLTIDTYAREDHIEAIRKSAEVLAKALDYYQQLWGESAAGKNYRLVEVADKLELQPGTLGTIFVTHREVGQPTPPVRELARRAAYQWWAETVGVQSADDLWLVDGMAYYSAALYLSSGGDPKALREEIDSLAVLGLKFESRSSIRGGISLGYGTDAYESVVAGKGAYVLNMLQGMMGPAKFADLMKNYAQQAAGSGGSTAILQKLAEEAYGKELGWFFPEWIDTTGVPNLTVDYVIYKTRDGFRLSGVVKQDRDLFRMPLEIEAIGEGASERTIVDLSGKSTPFDISIFSMPRRVLVDPDNKLLRDSDELRFKVQLTLGTELKQKGDLIDAVRAFEQALKINPAKSIAHFRMAEVFFEQMNLQTSANTFRDALNGDKDPRWIEVWCYIYLGKIYDILGQRQRALAEYNKALNTKDNTDGALDEAKKWLAAPYTRDASAGGKEIR